MTSSAESAPKAGKAARLAYKPVNLISGAVAGAVAGLVFRQIWKRVSDEDDAPGALEDDYPWGEIILAAILQGAIFAGVRAVVQRGGAKGFQRVTGTWPGD